MEKNVPNKEKVLEHQMAAGRLVTSKTTMEQHLLDEMEVSAPPPATSIKKKITKVKSNKYN